MTPDYLQLLRTIDSRADIYDNEPTRTYAMPKKRELAKLTHPEWLPDPLTAFLALFNGYTKTWQTEVKIGTKTVLVGGRIDIQRLQDICASWEGSVYFEEYLQAPEATPEEKALRDFKVVDMYTDEAGVGLYLTDRRNPQLYRCTLSEEIPQPLGVDFDGYLQLLTLSLGHSYGPQMMQELNAHYARQPHQAIGEPGNEMTRQFVAQMTAVLPEFSLEAFGELYNQVRLKT
jgi:hypothetical protein